MNNRMKYSKIRRVKMSVMTEDKTTNIWTLSLHKHKRLSEHVTQMGLAASPHLTDHFRDESIYATDCMTQTINEKNTTKANPNK